MQCLIILKKGLQRVEEDLSSMDKVPKFSPFCQFFFFLHPLLTLSLVVGMQKEAKLVLRMTTEVGLDKLDEAFSYNFFRVPLLNQPI